MAALLVGASALAAAAPSSRPNVVFIFADDWGWGDLSAHGHPWLKTPRLDRLASEGIDFQQFNVLNPVCSPSRTAATTATSAPPAKKATPDRAAAFARMDTNRDGVLTMEEYVAGLQGAANLEQRFKNFDQNGDGKLTRKEFVGASGK